MPFVFDESIAGFQRFTTKPDELSAALNAVAYQREGFRYNFADGAMDMLRAAREIRRIVLGRAKLWLLARFLAVFLLACVSAGPAHANGVSTNIGNGQILYGTVTGTGEDDYFFNCPDSTTYLFISLGRTGTTGSFRVYVYDNNGTSQGYGSGSERATYSHQCTSAGTWEGKVVRPSHGTS